MTRKVLSHDPNLCTGCMYCMIACSTHKEGATSLSRARLQIIRHEGHALTRIEQPDELVFALVGCQQCEEPICSAVCPVAAITKNEETGAMVIDHGKCVGCRLCLMACYFGAVSFNEKTKKVFKCDLCSGDPTCVKFCPVEALKFMPAEQVPLSKRAETARKTREGGIEKRERASDEGHIK